MFPIYSLFSTHKSCRNVFIHILCEGPQLDQFRLHWSAYHSFTLNRLNLFRVSFSREKLTIFFFFFKIKIPQEQYIERLKSIRATLQRSEFFRTHEVIGSSLLFVHDRNKASIWLIDFAKTISLPANTEISHKSEWRVGNHEDGYLIGINNLITIFDELRNDSSKSTFQMCDYISDSDAANQPFSTDDETKCIKCTKYMKSESTASTPEDESAVDIPSPEIKKLTINQSTENDCDSQ